MISVEMSDDIRKYETKDIGPFTYRQLICVLLAGIIFIIFAIILPVKLVFKLIFAALIALPVGLCGYIKICGLHLEGYLLRILYLYVLTPPKRKVKRDNPYRRALNNIKKAEEKAYYQSLSEKDKKAYDKKQKGIEIKYSQKAEFKIYR